jgi:plasmid stabilization system protein ParE
MSGYVLSRAADLDLDGLWNHIAEDSLSAADRLTTKLLDSFEALARHPGMGHKREDLTHYPVLFWPVENYLVIYRGDRSPIQIVAIVYGGRDIPTFLQGRDVE